MRNQRAFTIIELLVVIAIIGILARLAITAFSLYRASAAYASAESTLRFARTAAEAGTSDEGDLPAPVAGYVQSSAGILSNAAAADYMPGLIMPPDSKIQLSYDPSCIAGGCVQGWAQVNHCSGEKYAAWFRFGDGTDLLLQNIVGAGCP